MRPFSPFRWLSPAGSGARLSIFVFHRVLDRDDPLRPDEPDAARFVRIVEFIAANFRVLALADAAVALAQGSLPAAAACITFDDGYADNLTIAAPILRRHGASATVFVATAFIDGGRMWNDSVIEAVRAAPAGALDWRDFDLGQAVVGDDASRLALVQHALGKLKYLGVPERTAISDEMARRAGLSRASELMLSRAQLVEWRELGFDVGGHTVHHPILARLDDEQAWSEIADGREQLTQWLGESPGAFAYPNGDPGRDYGAREVAMVRRAGFACAVSTARAAAGQHADVYQLPRYMPWDGSMWAFGLRCARTLVGAGSTGVHDAQQINDGVRT